MNALLLLCLISIIPDYPPFIKEVDRLELNHFYDQNNGRIIMDQVVLYRGKYSQGYHQLLSRDNGPPESIPDDPTLATNPIFKRDNRITWYRYNGLWRIIVTDNHNNQYIYHCISEPYETWTIHDPELESRDNAEGESYVQPKLKVFP